MNPSETAAHIVEQERVWANAMQQRDLTQLNNLVTDDFFVTIAIEGVGIQTTRREPWLSVMPHYEILEMNLENIHATVYGDVAVATLMWTQRARVKGGERSGTFFITDIWHNVNGTWRVAQRHSSRPEPATAARPQ